MGSGLSITYSDFNKFTTPLKPEEFIHFDTKANSSLIALKRSDFEENSQLHSGYLRFRHRGLDDYKELGLSTSGETRDKE